VSQHGGAPCTFKDGERQAALNLAEELMSEIAARFSIFSGEADGYFVLSEVVVPLRAKVNHSQLCLRLDEMDDDIPF
jgi:hypothetical protein